MQVIKIISSFISILNLEINLENDSFLDFLDKNPSNAGAPAKVIFLKGSPI